MKEERRKKKNLDLFNKLSFNIIIKQIFLFIVMYVVFELLIVILALIGELVYFLTGIYLFSLFSDYGSDYGSFIISFILTLFYYPIHNLLTHSKSFRIYKYNLKYVFFAIFIFLIFEAPLVKDGADFVSHFFGNDDGSLLIGVLSGLLVFSIIAFVMAELIMLWIFKKFEKRPNKKWNFNYSKLRHIRIWFC